MSIRINTIYIITNIINKKIYIGQTWQTVKRRFFNHCCPSSIACNYLHKAIKKYGRKNFVVEAICCSRTQNDADFLETFFINEYNSLNNKIGYNLKSGGSGGIPSLETRKKMSKSGKGRIPWNKGKTGVISEEHKRKISEGTKGKIVIHSEETKKKIGMASSGRNKMSNEKENNIINFYLEGKKYIEISKDFDTCNSAIFQVLKRNNIKKNRGKGKSIKKRIRGTRPTKYIKGI
jgi:group I intron endonuclease